MLAIVVLLYSCHEKNQNSAKGKPFHPAVNEDARNVLDKAEKYDSLKQYDSAFSTYYKAKESYVSGSDSLYAGYSLAKMAGLQYMLADYSGCEETAVEALKYLGNNQQNGFLSATYNILGMCYKKLLMYDASIRYYKKAASITTDTRYLSIIQNNIASIYTESGDYSTALPILQRLKQEAVVNNDSVTKARVLNNLGELYFKLNKPDAVAFLNDALAIRQKINDPKDLIASYINLAEYYRQIDRARSKAYALKVTSIAKRIKNVEDRLHALRILISITRNSEYENYSSQYIALQDSVTAISLRNKGRFAAIKYNAVKMEAANRKLETENALSKLKVNNDKIYKIRLTGTLILLAIISIFVIYVLILRHRKEKLLQVYKTETRISKKIHDELANDVFNVISIAESHDFSLPLKQQKLVQNLDRIYNKTRDISRENNDIDTGAHFPAALMEMLADYKTPDTNVITVNFEPSDWDQVEMHKKITVYRVLQELMVNMKKHSQATMAAIKFTNKDEKITIEYNDNGRGLGNSALIYKNGLQNAETRILSVGGSITFDSKPDKGLKVIIVLPVK